MVQRTSAGGISRMGRPTQGVRVMNLKSDDRVSAVALVVESTEADAEVEVTPSDGAGPDATDGGPPQAAQAAKPKRGRKR